MVLKVPILGRIARTPLHISRVVIHTICPIYGFKHKASGKLFQQISAIAALVVTAMTAI